MGIARGTLSQEEFEEVLEEVSKRLAACEGVEAVADVWKDYFGRLGHKALGRLLIGMTPEAVAKKRQKSMLGL